MKPEFSKKSQISNVIKIRPAGAELFHADRRADMKLTVAFRNFEHAPKSTTKKSVTAATFHV